MFISELLHESYVTRIDDHPIGNFAANLQTYYHTDDWRESGKFPKGTDIPKRFTNKSRGLFAGDPKFTALYATGSSEETRYVAKYKPGQPIVWFDKKDLSRIRGKQTYLTVFNADDFKRVPSGEYFSTHPGQPVKQEKITDPFQYITDQGWVIRVTDDLSAVLKKLQQQAKENDSIQYGAEGMEVVTETFDQPYPIKWEKGEFGDYDALTTLADGTYLSIMFNQEEDGEYQIEFHRNNSQDVTGEGDAHRIFATVLTAIQQFIEQHHPARIRFSATKDDDNDNQSRTKLYDRLVQRYAASWGYSVDVTDHAGSTVYELSNDLNEVTMVPTVAKSKREHLDVMPNDGRPIPKGDESDYLGDLVAEMDGGYQLWSWESRWDRTYFVFDTETRICQLATTGKQYPENPNSFVVLGVYSGPQNRYRAADLYAFLILSRGLTLVSDNKQSEGGYRVWQELERRYGKKINVHGFDTRTDTGVNVTTQDEPETHVARADIKKAGPQMKRELGTISRDLRFVASAR